MNPVAGPVPSAGGPLSRVAPALLGAASFACADVLSKAVLEDGADALTVSSLRGALGLAMLLAWLRLARPPLALAPAEKWVSLGLGVLFAGNIFLLFTAFATIEVPI